MDKPTLLRALPVPLYGGVHGVRRHIHRAALLLLTLIVFACPDAISEATQQNLTINAHANPAQMVLAQDTSFVFALENLTRDTLYSVTVLFPEANGQQLVGDIAGGAVATAEFTYPVTDEDLNLGSITFSVTSCDAGGNALPTQQVSVPVTRETERPEVEFTRQISSRYAHAGDDVTLVYQVKNTGNVPLTGLELNDPLGDYTQTLDALAVGETQTFINRVQLQESAASTPTLRFASVASGQNYTKSLSSASITLADEAIYAQLSVDKTEVSYGDSVTLTLTLTNNGNVSFSDVTLTDSVLGMLENEPLSLPSGASPVVIARSCVIKSNTTFRVHVSGNTDAGTPFAVDTDPVTVSVLQAEGATDLTLTAVPSARTLSEPGMVSFTLTLTNNGQSDLSRVTLKEATRGEVRVFDIVPAGAPTVKEQMYDVTEDCTFQFVAEITDADGNVRSVSSDAIEITIGEGGLAPMATATTGLGALLYSNALRVGNVSLYPILIALVLLLILLLVAALIASNRRKKRQRNANRAERQKRSEALGRTNRFIPVSRNRKNKEGKH